MNTKKMNHSIVYRINYLLKNHSNYDITKKTHIYENTLRQIRIGNANVLNLALDTVLKLDHIALDLYGDSMSSSAKKRAKKFLPDIIAVITSHLTSYYLSKKSGLRESTYCNLRLGETNLARLYFKSAVTIYHFYLKHTGEIRLSDQHPTAVTNMMVKNVLSLIHSGCSSYKVAKQAHLSPSVTSRMFRGKTNLRYASPKTMYIMSKYYLIHHKSLAAAN